MLASDRLVARIPAGRLLLHVLEATAHARELGAAPDSCVRLLNEVGIALLDTGQLDTSQPLLERALAIAHAQLGPDHPDTLLTRRNLASWLGRSGQPGEAASQFRQLLNDHLRVLSPDHLDTLRTRNNLAYWKKKLSTRDHEEPHQKQTGEIPQEITSRPATTTPN